MYAQCIKISLFLFFKLLVSSFQKDTVKAQSILNAWYEVLKFTWHDLKLAKCYWTLQVYLWQDGVCTWNESSSNEIRITTANSKTTIKHGPNDKIIILVRVLIEPSNDPHDVEIVLSR